MDCEFIIGPNNIRGERITKLRRPDGSEFFVIVPFMGMEEDDKYWWPGWIHEIKEK